MYDKLAEVELKTGEFMEVGVITTPDEVHAEEIKRFLGHKPGKWQSHIERCVLEQLDALEPRFYVGKIRGKVIVNIMTIENRGIGTLGHVFTLPEQRQKGACKNVMEHQIGDFRARGGKALYLGTAYKSRAYYIYASFGFESVFPGSGFMKHFFTEDFDNDYFRLASVHAKNVEWHDWPRLTALTGVVEGDYVRSIEWGIYGRANFEGGFLDFKQALEEVESYHDAKLLESEAGAIVGVGMVTWDRRWRPPTGVLDLFVHPTFWASASVLLSEINLPDGKVQCYVDAESKAKTNVLEAAGFHCEATLKNQIQRDDQGIDVLIFARH